ncbi:MAG: hypothetical protein D6689_21445 [Deltaproteobacteria bacterium]|nr:MAG: hypothetical protein D6689_21445 [Deltaproteobacteria bacterium]
MDDAPGDLGRGAAGSAVRGGRERRASPGLAARSRTRVHHRRSARRPLTASVAARRRHARIRALAGLVAAAACAGPPSRPPAHDAAAIDATPRADAARTDAARTDAARADAAAADAARPDAPPRADAGPCATAADGTPCDDGDACTQVDVCAAGVCAGTAPVVCESSACRAAGTCDPATGRCDAPPLPDGTACDDGSVCTAGDTCRAGTCEPGERVPPPGPPCSEGLCFAEVSAAAGIDWTGTTALTQRIGATAVFADVDGDGWLDALVGAEGGPPRLYRNRGDGTFADVTASAGLAAAAAGAPFMAAAAADYDNDGDVDLFLMRWGPNRLLANDGTGAFVDVTAAAGVAGDGAWTTAAAFGDFDGDGWLDLYVGNYVREVQFPTHVPEPNRLYRNRGDGTFEDVTAITGTAGAGTTLAVAWTDYDGDGDADLMVCNDFGAFIEPNRLYRNDGAGAFAEVAADEAADVAIYCMAIAPGDYDRDGDLDYYLANIGHNPLLARTPAGFVDRADAAGADVTHDACFTDLFATSWGAAFADFDDDGWLDLFVSNGYIPADESIANPVRAVNALLHHQGPSLTFADVAATAGVDDDGPGRAIAVGDYDRDGDLDVLQVTLERALLWRNDSPAAGGAIHLQPRGRASAADGIGLQVRADLAGGAVVVREVAAQTGYMATHERAAHLGLGAAPRAEVITFRWPSGAVHRWRRVPAGTRATVVEPWVTVAAVVPATAQVAPGTDATARVTLANRGAVPVDIAVTAELASADRTAAGAPVAVTVPAGGTAPADVRVAVPADWPAGAAELIARARDDAGARDDAAVAITVTVP